MLGLRLFGSGRLFDGVVEIKLPSREWTLPVLAYLALHRGEVIPRKRLASTLWPDEPEEWGLQTLRRNLHRLVKALPPAPESAPWIAIDGHNISWNQASAFELDVAQFERFRNDEATLERAVAFYGGDLLSEIVDDWVGAERDRLRRLYHADLATLIAANRSRRAFAVAVRYAQQLLASDPWHEDAIRALMSARYESGDAAGALAEFELFARTLHTEMNVAPMPETIALREAIARGAAIPSILNVSEPAAKRVPDASPFVGRREELERLRSRWVRTVRGNGGVAFVCGEAGIGKSRLVSELALIAEGEGGRVLAATTSLPERDPYQCLSAAVRDALPLLAGITLAPPLLAAIAQLVPELRSYRTDVPEFVRLDPSSERERLFDALAQMFLALARPRPLLVILEDVHRAGAATIEAIDSIMPRLSRSPVLMVATYRDVEVGRTHPLHALVRDSQAVAERVDLGPLHESDVGLLVEALDTRDSPPEFLTTLVRRSGGNPLFVTELLRDAQRSDSQIFAMPVSVSAMITDRVASLAAASRSVAEIAAVAGEAFTVDIVREIAGLPKDEMLDGLDELLDRHVVRESTERGRYEYAFTHHLVHAAIYDAIPPDARARRHRRIARILDTAVSGSAVNTDERAGEIALHYERGGDPKNAALRYATMAQRAARLNANAEARDLISRALGLEAGSDRERFELVLLRCRMNGRLADVTAESSDIAELERLASRLDENAICAALEHRAHLAFRLGDLTAETAAVERLTRHAASAGGERWAAAAAWSRARREHKSGDFGSMIESALRGRECYKLLGDNARYAKETGAAAYACSLTPGRAADAERFATEALTLAEQAGDAEAHLWVLRYAGAVANELEDAVRFLERARLALGWCLKLGHRGIESQCRSDLGEALAMNWHIDEALSELREAMRLAESCSAIWVINPLRILAEVFVRVGDFSSASDCSLRAREAALAHDDIIVFVESSIGAADAAWRSGNVAELRAIVDKAVTTAADLPESRFAALLAQLQGRALRCERDFDASALALERAIAIFVRTERPVDIVNALDELALTALASGRLRAAQDALERGTSALRARTTPGYAPAFHDWIGACVHRAAGREDEARNALRCAHDVYVQRLAGLSDHALRASFEATPVHRALGAALECDEWPASDLPCAVAFPGVAGVTASPALSRLPVVAASSKRAGSS
jgi:DNA-binding SARP family transcriptional activator/tetratricopeptide (TPR) repeat protein